MRIISGIHKSRRFEVPRSFKARPTTDFAKENIFNVVCNLIDLKDASSLDLFSGTGSIAFELVSRGCGEVVAIEKDPAHYSFIRKIQAELKADNMHAICKDVFRYIKSTARTFDFIFADPPYTLRELPQLPELVFSHKLLNPDGIFILEHSKEHDFSSSPHFLQHRFYGSVNFSLFRTTSLL
ncbi:MAG: RsmD family RNA methyltransferase [Dysgonamonadaceae bacterium]|jgi:16S rRNA (guanine(966)-N(2))-methyltransferase RsmD|nr:RsmD family RNA methyltransferase [Dysgonamonadaceae bacterium]